MLFNYKDGEKCISLDELGDDKEKKPNTQNKCSTLIKSGDPSGNRTRDTLIKRQRKIMPVNGSAMRFRCLN